jgi:hypothetical protein
VAVAAITTHTVAVRHTQWMWQHDSGRVAVDGWQWRDEEKMGGIGAVLREIRQKN